MKHVLFFLVCSFHFSISGFAQDKWDDNWIFGKSPNPNINATIVEFNTFPPLVNSIYAINGRRSGSVTMSDASGNLIFYSNGCDIVNAHHEIMENGDSIASGYILSSFCDTGGSPLAQGVLSLPVPNSDSNYYVFTLNLESPYEFPVGLYFPLAPTTVHCHEVDMGQNGGLGKVVSKKQVVVQDTFGRGMLQACRHHNGAYWWLLAPKSHSNCYHTILVTEEGIMDSTVQCVGHVWDDIDTQGQAVFSPDGKTFVRFIYHNGVNVYKFDDSTGLFSDPIQVTFEDVDTFYFSGAAISPNSRYLYATAYTKVFQFDLQADDIPASRVLVAELDTPPNLPYDTKFYQARLAPDGKIYIAGTNSSRHLHVIHQPNCQGTLCDLEQYALELTTLNSFTMPNFPHFRSWENSPVCDTTVSASSSINSSPDGYYVYPNPAINSIRINGQHGVHEELIFELFELTGKKVLEKRIFPADEPIVDLRGATTGLYFYKIKSLKKEIVFSGKLIVMSN